MNSPLQTYQLFILVEKEMQLQIGKLGVFTFPAGHYVYTGSAKRNMDARISRHYSIHKKIKWHIDYLLAAADVSIFHVKKFREGECQVNRKTDGIIPAPGFGASDCREGCISHLKYLGADAI